MTIATPWVARREAKTIKIGDAPILSGSVGVPSSEPRRAKARSIEGRQGQRRAGWPAVDRDGDPDSKGKPQEAAG